MNTNKNIPFVFTEEIPLDDLGGGVKRKILAYGDGLMLVEVHFEEGAVGALHSHPHTQITYVVEGEFEFTIGDEKKVVRKGDSMYDCPEIVHGCKCLKEGVLLDVFTPIREDFLKK